MRKPRREGSYIIRSAEGRMDLPDDDQRRALRAAWDDVDELRAEVERKESRIDVLVELLRECSENTLRLRGKLEYANLRRTETEAAHAAALRQLGVLRDA